MNWFNHTRKEVSETDLIAFHLHELSPRREREVAQALQASATLATTSAAVETTLRALKDTPHPIEQAAFARTWHALQPTLVPYTKPPVTTPRWRTPALAAATVAILAGVGAEVFTLADRKPAPHPEIATSASPSSTLEPSPGIPTHAAKPLKPAPSSPAIRIALPPLTDSFRGKVSGGVYHLPQPDLPPIVHSLALAPTKGPLPAISAESPHYSPQDPPTPLLTGTVTQQPLTETLSATPAPTVLTAKPQAPHPLHNHVRTDLMLAVGGTLIMRHSSLTAGTEPRTETATHAIAAIAAFHQQFRPALGYRLTLSYTRPDFNYIYGSGNGGIFGSGGIDSRIFEAAATYVVRGPHHGRLTTAADAGAALMAFLPTPDPSTSYVYRPAGVLGANAEFALGKHWSARATYRAQVFRSPGFRYTGGTIPVTTPIVLSNEPAIGIVYRFGKPVAPTAKP